MRALETKKSMDTYASEPFPTDRRTFLIILRITAADIEHTNGRSNGSRRHNQAHLETRELHGVHFPTHLSFSPLTLLRFRCRRWRYGFDKISDSLIQQFELQGTCKEGPCKHVETHGHGDAFQQTRQKNTYLFSSKRRATLSWRRVELLGDLRLTLFHRCVGI